MKKNIFPILIILLSLIFFSCRTVPVNEGAAYYLPDDGDRTLYLDGSKAEAFLRPMTESFGVDDYESIEPLLKATERIYLVTRGEALFIQGQGDYNTGFISFVLRTNRDWKKEKIGPFKTYYSQSTSLQLAFPDSRTFFISQGNLSDLLEAYHGGGSVHYPFTPEREKSESLLLRLSLDKGDLLPMQELLKIPFKSAEMALSPGEDDLLLMDVSLRGEENSGRVMGTALKLFLLASVGRSVMNSPMETGNDFASISDVSVDLDFLLDMIGI